MLTRVIHGAVDLLFPPQCILCRGWVGAGTSPLCSGCSGLIENDRKKPACPTCASSVAPYEVSERRCRWCRGGRLPIVETVRVAQYAEGLGQLVRSYKYHGREELEPVLGGWLAQAVDNAPWLDRVEAVVSVPTHWKHRITRPLYAADALASIVAAKIGMRHVPLLRRVRAGPHQIGLSYAQRLRNVRGAFALRRNVTLRDARLLLIDDVKTTGATLNECAKVLRRGGAAEVYAAIVVTAGWDRSTGQTLPSI